MIKKRSLAIIARAYGHKRRWEHEILNIKFRLDQKAFSEFEKLWNVTYSCK